MGIGGRLLTATLINMKSNGIYAKTGTLSGVSALSGYISSMDTFFSIIINNSLVGYSMYASGEGPFESSPGERFGCFEYIGVPLSLLPLLEPLNL